MDTLLFNFETKDEKRFPYFFKSLFPAQKGFGYSRETTFLDVLMFLSKMAIF